MHLSKVQPPIYHSAMKTSLKNLVRGFGTLDCKISQVLLIDPADLLFKDLPAHLFCINSASRNPNSLPTGRQAHLKWANFFRNDTYQ
jgi:hypothetical protein